MTSDLCAGMPQLHRALQATHDTWPQQTVRGERPAFSQASYANITSQWQHSSPSPNWSHRRRSSRVPPLSRSVAADTPSLSHPSCPPAVLPPWLACSRRRIGATNGLPTIIPLTRLYPALTCRTALHSARPPALRPRHPWPWRDRDSDPNRFTAFRHERRSADMCM